MFWNVIDDSRRTVLNNILEHPPIKGIYLAGGTALALQIGHRESVDFDWFTAEEFDPVDVENALNEMGQVLVTDTKRNTFHGFLNGVQITFLRYRSPMLSPLETPNTTPPLQMASLLDIGLMKLIAVSQRGAKKDFIDIYGIHQQGLSLSSMLTRLPEKFPDKAVNLYHIIKSLVYFDDADQEPMPRMLQEWQWDEIKDFFRSQQHFLWKTIKDD